MGTGFLTRVAMASFYGIVAVSLFTSSVGFGLLVGLTFGIGRAMPVLVAGKMEARSSDEVRWFIFLFVGRLREWRLTGALVMAAACGVAVTRGLSGTR
jgi:sulfite exporter TauE/SafE